MVRLDVEFLKQGIVAAFDAYAGDMHTLLEAEVDRAIKAFDWKTEVAEVAAAVIRDVVRTQITTAMSHLKWDDALRKELAKAVLREMTGEP